jgi:hypothetical protein
LLESRLGKRREMQIGKKKGSKRLGWCSHARLSTGWIHFELQVLRQHMHDHVDLCVDSQGGRFIVLCNPNGGIKITTTTK